MPLTTNYNWETPTPGGDAGVWGTKLNEALEDADVTVKALADTTADAAAVLDAAKLDRAGGLITGPVRHSLTDLGSVSGSTAVNLASGNVFRCTLSGNTTFSFSNAPSSTQPMFVALEIQASGQTVNWPSITWDGGAKPALSSGANVVVLMIRGTTIRGTHAVKP